MKFAFAADADLPLETHCVIDLASGEAQAPDIGCVKRTPLRLEGERILLGLPA